jgi:hypothetical protein
VSARLILSVGIVLSAAACGGQVPAGSKSGSGSEAAGLHGIVTISPGMPTCKPGEPCGRPARNVTLAFVQDGKTVATTKTDEQGLYRVALPAGQYEVSLRNGAPSKVAQAKTVSVSSGASGKHDFSFDIGIR